MIEVTKIAAIVGSISLDISKIAKHGGRIIGGSFLSTACLFVLFSGVQGMPPGLTRTIAILSLIACFFSGAWTAVLQDMKQSVEILPRLMAYVVSVLAFLILASVV